MSHYGLLDKAVGSSVPLESVWIRTTVHGCAAQVIATLEYKNKGVNPIDAIFIFPLDEQAVVCGFQATVDGRTVVAVIQEQRDANGINDDVIRNDQNAKVLEEDDDNSDIFQISIGNVPPNKTAVVQLTYVTELGTGKEGEVAFVLPTVLNPRYNPSSDVRFKRAGSRIASVNSKYSFDFELEVQSASSIQKITSPCSRLKVEINAADRRQATARLSGEYGYDGEMEIHVLNTAPLGQVHALIENGVTTKSADKFLSKPIVMLNYCPDFENSASQFVRGEFIFLVDRSKHMAGEKIERAREALLLFLNGLPNGCHFNVIGYGASYVKLFAQSEKYSDSAFEAASDFAWAMKAGLDGAEIIEPLRDVYSQPPIAGSPRQVFILTGGEANNTEQVVDEVRKNAHIARCFTFGIGASTASSDLVRRVARVGRGSAEIVTSLDRVQPKVMSMMTMACQPVVTDLQVSWNLPEGWVARCIPHHLPPVYKGDRLVLCGLLMRNDNNQPRYIIAVEGKATLRGTMNAGDTPKAVHHEVKFSALCGNPVDRSVLLHRLVAKSLIQEEESKHGWNMELAGAAAKAPIISLSKSANVVSKVTSFIAVDKHTQQPITARRARKRRQSFETFAQSAPGGRIFGLKAVNMKIPIPSSTNGVMDTTSPVFASEISPGIISPPPSVPLPLSTTRTVGFSYKAGSASSPTSPPQKVMGISSNAPQKRQDAAENSSSPLYSVSKTIQAAPKQFNFASTGPTIPPQGPTSPLQGPTGPTSSPHGSVTTNSQIFVPGRRREEFREPIIVELPVDSSDAVGFALREARGSPISPPHRQPAGTVHRESTSPMHREPTSPIHREPISPPHTEPTNLMYGKPINLPYRQPASPIHREPPSPMHREPINPPQRQQAGLIHKVHTSPMYGEPINLSYRQPASPIHKEPTSLPHMQTDSPINRDPNSTPYRQPTSPPYRQPASPTQRQPTSPPYRQPASPTQRQPASPPYRQPASPTQRQPTISPYKQPASPPYRQPIVATDGYNFEHEGNSDMARTARGPPTSPKPQRPMVNSTLTPATETNQGGLAAKEKHGPPTSPKPSRPIASDRRSLETESQGSCAQRGYQGSPPSPPPRSSSQAKRVDPPGFIRPSESVPQYCAPATIHPPQYFDQTQSQPKARDPGMEQTQLQPEPRDPGMELVSLQKPSGAWLLDEKLAGLCGVSLDELRQSCPVSMETAWATALALVCLNVRFLKSKREWYESAELGSDWLMDNIPPGGLSYNGLMDRAAAIIQVTVLC